jgi:hypothetical protein
MAKVYVEPVSSDPQFERDGPLSLTRSDRRSRVLIGLSVTISLLVLLILTTELSSLSVLSFYRASQRRAIFAPTLHLKFYRNKSWAKQYWKEAEEAERFSFAPYTITQRKPFAGQYINVDTHGIRRTANPDCSPTALRIWMFGGSVLWGWGAKDDETIPSILSQKYAKSIGPVCITNFGEDAHVSTQEIIQLEIELKHTLNPPNLVLFYDGYGDMLASYQTGREDPLMDFEPLRQKVEKRDTGLEFLKGSGTYQLVATLMSGILKLKKIGDESSAAEASREKQMDLDAHMAAANFLGNVRLLQSLSEQFSFRYLVFWSPVSFQGNKPLDPDERKATNSFEFLNPGIAQLSRKGTDLVFAAPNKHVVNLTDVFDHTPDQVYVDYGHLNPIGNGMIAERILETIRKSGIEPESTHRGSGL